MKLAIVTDLHANREAVAAVLAHAQGQGAEQFAFVGDFVGYGADPAWVVDVVRAHVRRGAFAVLGNHDLAVGRSALATMQADARAVVEWTRAQLDPQQIDFLATLPLQLQTGGLLFVHANAYQPAGWGYIQGRLEAARSMAATNQRVTFCGHVHEPMLYTLSAVGKAGQFTPTPGDAIPLLESRQWLVIPGSAGQPRDGDPAACYAIYDDVASELTYWRVPYDVEAASAKMRAVGLPQTLATRLIDGT